MSIKNLPESERLRSSAPALERGLRILAEFNATRPSWSAPELAKKLSVPRSTLFRLLEVLEELGYLTKSASGKEYRLGLGVLRLGFEYLATLDLAELGKPILERLCAEIGYPCTLAVRDGRDVVYVAKVTPPTPFSGNVSLGTRLPAHATVLGRVLLQGLSLQELQRLYPEKRLEKFSPLTPQTVAELHATVVKDSAQPYVLSEGYFRPDISILAVPIRRGSGGILGTLGVSITKGYSAPIRDEELISLACKAADELAGALRQSALTEMQGAKRLAELD